MMVAFRNKSPAILFYSCFGVFIPSFAVLHVRPIPIIIIPNTSQFVQFIKYCVVAKLCKHC